MSESVERLRQPTLVVGVDFRVDSLRALRHSMRMLERGLASEVHVVHVLEGDRAQDAALRTCVPTTLAQLALDVGGAPHETSRPPRAWAHVRAGVAALELRRLAFDVCADLIVIGERGDGAPEQGTHHHRDPLAPFSVLVAGRELVLDSRSFECGRCSVCDALRSAPETTSLWCPAHARPGVDPLPIEPRPELRDRARVLH